MTKLLIVEDDIVLLDVIKNFLEKNGYYCWCAENPDKAMNLFNNNKFELILIDIKFTGSHEDGFSLIRRIRKYPIGEDKKNQTPIIVVSGQNDLDSKITAYKSGADDYIIKPILPLQELLLKVESVIRRNNKNLINDYIDVGILRLDKDRNILYVNLENVPIEDLLIELTETQLKFIKILASKKGYQVKKIHIMEELYPNRQNSSVYELDNLEYLSQNGLNLFRNKGYVRNNTKTKNKPKGSKILDVLACVIRKNITNKIIELSKKYPIETKYTYIQTGSSSYMFSQKLEKL